MVNRVILIGNLGKDPEVRRLENGAVVAKFTLATNESYKDKSGEWQQLTEWHDVVVWRSLAERAEAQLKKGMPVYVEGKLTHRTWQDQDGNNRRSTEVVANYFRSLASGRKEGDGGGGYFPGADDEYPVGNFSPEPKMSSTASSMPDVQPPAGDDDDLPF
ncbi:MAG TPA: single-stranded DNA-binding protein [Flavilitoribacter sp.]|nr:single-stranded DNA-binding protein [Lewinella sp.]MCB9281044.1 single-stranded DNA-binding protein [Lewinellaceae bacterium]HMQ61374.1 single-stranded DNA-binding protein [Flavilitoribacter sp.]HMQ86441.1 single-stranded DNA-binding protein [Flavilitoribacter sp.]